MKSAQAYRNPPTLKGWSAPEGMAQQCVRAGKIYRASVELLDDCREKCPYCYRGNDAAKKPAIAIPLERAKWIVNQAIDCGAEAIALNGGEPLRYSYLREMVSHINSLGKTSVIFTSGTEPMDATLANFLFENNATMIVKRNSYDDASIQNFMLGRKKKSGEALLQIKNTLALLAEAGFNKAEPTRLAIETIISSFNASQIPRLFRWARQNNVYPFFELVVPVNPTGRKMALGKEEAKKEFENLLKIDRREFGFSWIPRPPYVAARCEYFQTAAYIRSDQKVQPCPSTGIELGDLKKESLAQILKNKAALLWEISKNLRGKCKGCAYNIRAECYGCRGRAFNVEGDVLASDPICWQPGKITG